jgi:hypothetical protein
LVALGDTLKNVEDVMPIATGHEREELEAVLEVCLFISRSLLPGRYYH